MGYLRDIYTFRGFIVGSVQREFANRYRHSMLGAAWLLLQPLAQILIYTLVFSSLMHARLPGVESAFGYGIFLCAGVLTWGLFAEVLARFQNMFIENANLIKKLNFPSIALPVIGLINACMGFAIIFGLFTAFLVVSGSFPGWVYLALAPVLLVQLLFASGLGLCVGVLNVFFRDVGQMLTLILQFWFWLTPIVYPASTLPPWAQSLISLNPMTPLVLAYQAILLGASQPDWQSLLPVLILGALLCGLGLGLYRRHAGEMADEL